MLMQPPPHMRSDMKEEKENEKKIGNEDRKQLTRGGFQQRSSFQEGERPFWMFV